MGRRGMVEVPEPLLRKLLGIAQSNGYTAASTAVADLLVEDPPRIVAVELNKVTRRGSHGEIMLYSDFTNKPDLLKVLDQAIESVDYLCAPGDKWSNIDRVKFRTRRAIEGAIHE